MLGHVLSKEQSKDGSDGASNDGSFSATITTDHVRATAERLSRDLTGDPKHIYKHKYDRKAHLAGDPKRKG